jgi:hypothetical protein
MNFTVSGHSSTAGRRVAPLLAPAQAAYTRQLGGRATPLYLLGRRVSIMFEHCACAVVFMCST